MDNLNTKVKNNEDGLALHRKAFERRLHKLAQREDAGTDNRVDCAPEAGHDVKAGKIEARGGTLITELERRLF